MNNAARQAQFAAFIGRRQLKAIQHLTQGAEGAWFRAKLVELAKIFATMHKIYEQDGKGDAAIVHLRTVQNLTCTGRHARLAKPERRRLSNF